MGRTYSAIDDSIRDWLARQQMFFVATAPLAADASINLSPKGIDTLRVLGPRRLAWLDYGGSGVETIAHLRENGRIVLMLCAFEGPPKIFRFHGRGRVVTPLDAEFASLLAHFDRSQVGVRSIVDIDLTRISDSCGFGVPLYDFRAQRDISPNYVRSQGAERVRSYLVQHSRQSIDGLPGLTAEEAAAFQPPQDA